MAQGGARTPIASAMDPNSIGVQPTNEGGSATVMIYLRDQYGGSPATPPIFTVSSVTFNSSNVAPPRPFEGGWVLTGLRPGDEYDIEVSVSGYKVAHQTVMVPDGGSNGNITVNAIIYIRSTNETEQPVVPSGPILAPRAEKEVQHALKDLRENKLPSAQNHLGKALQMAPANPFVNYLMGMCYLRLNKLPEAKASLEKSVSIDPKGSAALLALGMLHYRESDYPGAIEILEQAVQLDATAWKADWMLASSYLHEGNFEKARDYSERALKTGKDGAAPVELLLGEAEGGLGERGKAIAAFEAFLKAYPRDPSVPQVREWIDSLKKDPTVSGKTAPASLAVHSTTSSSPTENSPAALSASLSPLAGPQPAPAVEVPPKENWAPPDIDAVSPPVVSARACSLPSIMAATKKSSEELVSDLAKFSATEEYESVEIKRNEQLETPETREFSYLVMVDNSGQRFPQVTEFRTQLKGPSVREGSIEDVSAPVLALAFHPDFRNDFKWTCEGLGEWNNQPAWVVHFEQRSDVATSRLQSFDAPTGAALLPLKGRAWISKSGGHVIHMETDLAKSVKTINLKREHFAIDYRPVAFHKHKVTLWLPENVDVYLQYQGHYLHHYHHFSQFQLFWVGETQKIEQPKEATQQP